MIPEFIKCIKEDNLELIQIETEKKHEYHFRRFILK